MFDRFDFDSMVALTRARREARELDQLEVCSEHVLLGLIDEPAVADLLLGMGVTTEELRYLIAARSVRRGSAILEESLPFGSEVQDVFTAACEEADGFGHARVCGAHLLLGLLKEPFGVAGRVLEGHGASLDGMRHEVLELLAALDGAEVDLDAA